jgi:hypothetical protein
VNRLVRWTTCALVGAASLTSCATFDDSAAVSVNGEDLTDEELADMAQSSLMTQVLQSPSVDGVIAGDELRGLITAWTRFEIYNQTGLLDDQSKADAQEQLAELYGPDWEGASPELREFASRAGAYQLLTSQGAIDPAVVDNAVADARIRVDPHYGYWDHETGRVERLGDSRSAG